MTNNQSGPKDERQIALRYIKALADTAREPFLIIDANLRAVSANESFYQTFQTSEKETENKFVYDLGNRQWDIPELRQLLEAILPRKKVIKDYEVEHTFPKIGLKVMYLNARKIDSLQLIIVCFEDITVRRAIEEKAADYTKSLEVEVGKRTADLENRVKELEELTKVMVGRELKMSELKKEITRVKKLKKLNHNNGENSK